MGENSFPPIYTFHRAEGFYPLHMPSGDAEAIANAECNPGTLAVRCAFTGRLVWGSGDDPAASKRGEGGASHQSDDVGSLSPSRWKDGTP